MAKKRKKSGGPKPTSTPSASKPATSTSKPAAASEPVAAAKPAPAVEAKASDAKSTTPAAPAIVETPSAGKLRREALRKQRNAHLRALPASGAPVPEPAFFFGFEISWTKLVLARVVVFSILALDAIMQISHAPRYGAGGFNVAQLPLLDAIGPGREAYSMGQLISAYLLVLAACGVATRVVLPIVTVLYGWLYFGSHLDSYQHHYLVFLLLLLSCAVPWQRPIDVTPATPIRSWAIRLILIQLGIVYLWAAISKMNGEWVSGRVLTEVHMKSFADSFASTKTIALGVLVSELVLAATIWIKRAWPVAAPLGIALHIGILDSGLDIGLFAWLMLGLYVLVVPDRVLVWIAETPPLRAIRRGVAHVASWFHSSARFAVWVVAAGAGAVLAMLSRFDHGPAIGLTLVIALIAGTIYAVLRKRTHVAWLAIAHLLALTLWTVADRATSTAMDYYRFWGGSSRRLGDMQTAEHAYRAMTEVAPDEGQGFYQLGRLLLARGAGEDGIAALRRAQTLEPLRARAYVAEARWLAQHNRRDEAIEKAREATIVEPDDQEARTLLNSLLGTP